MQNVCHPLKFAKTSLFHNADVFFYLREVRNTTITATKCSVKKNLCSILIYISQLFSQVRFQNVEKLILISVRERDSVNVRLTLH